MEANHQSNAQFASTESFGSFCNRANVKPTARQASKFRNGRGSAYVVYFETEVKAKAEQERKDARNKKDRERRQAKKVA